MLDYGFGAHELKGAIDVEYLGGGKRVRQIKKGLIKWNSTRRALQRARRYGYGRACHFSL